MKKIISLLSVLSLVVVFTLSSFAQMAQGGSTSSRGSGVNYNTAVCCTASYSNVRSDADAWATKYGFSCTVGQITTSNYMMKENWSLMTSASKRVSNTSSHANVTLNANWPIGATTVFTYGEFNFVDSTYGNWFSNPSTARCNAF